MSALPPHVQAEVQRILDRAARRLLAERLHDQLDALDDERDVNADDGRQKGTP